MISLVVLVLYAGGAILFGRHGGENILVPGPAAALAAITAIVSLAAYVWAPARYLFILAFGTYLLLVVTSGVLIGLTGQGRSPYIALWMILAVFAGLFGAWGLISVFLITNGAFILSLMLNPMQLTSNQLVIFFLASEVPLLVSFMIWHEKSSQETSKAKAFTALAKQLSQVANKSEVVINAIADGVLAIDTAGTVQLINPAAQQLLGWGKDDVIGLDYQLVLKLIGKNGQELERETTPIQQVLVTNKAVVNNDLQLVTHYGAKIMASLAVSPIGDERTVAGAIVVFRDITEEKEQERAKGEFISTASHEMRTPVAAIEGYLSLALNPATATIDDKAHAYLEKAHEATEHLGRLFQDLLTVSRAEDGRLSPKPTVVDIVAFIRDITSSLGPKAQAKGLFLSFKPDGNSGEEGVHMVPPVFYSYLDQDHLREIANNLIDNAIKYTKRGTINVDVTGDDTNVFLTISDTGIGIPPEDIPHLFQKFYRIDNSETREIGGTGLGLYICRRLAEANNGHLSVTSVFGRGSTFQLQLPRLTHERAAELTQKQASANTPHT